MTTPGEITATEKLLDLIRASSSSADSTNVEKNDSPSSMSQSDPPDLILTLDDDPVEVQSPATPPEPQEQPPAFVDDPRKINDDDDISFPSLDELNEPEQAWKPPAPSLVTSAIRPIRTVLKHLLSFRRMPTTTIGIDIQPGIIHLVTAHDSGSGPNLLSCESVTFSYAYEAPPKNLYEDPEFMAVLFRTLSGYFTNDHGHHGIWCSYAFCSPVVLHNVDTPKVAEKNLADAVFWSTKRELEFDEENTIFDFTLLQELNETTQSKIQALVTLMPRAEMEGVTKMFKNAGFPLTGLTFPAAAIQNFLHHDSSIPTDQPVVYFTIRRTRSFIYLFYRGKMFFSREIKTGIDSFIESFLDHALAQNIVIDEATAREYLFRGDDKYRQPSRSDKGDMISRYDWDKLKVLDRFVRQLVRTFEYCATTFKIPPVGTIVTSGEFTLNDTILKSIESRIGIKCSVLDPLSSAIFHRDRNSPVQSATNLMVATGLALSSKQRTANFLYTYAHRAREVASAKVNSIIAVATLCLAIALGGMVAVQYRQSLDKQDQVAQLAKQLEHNYAGEPRSRNLDYISQTTRKIGQFHHDNREKIRRFQSIAILNELTNALGDEVTVSDVTLDLAPPPVDSSSKSKVSPSAGVTISGFIDATVANQEFVLMNLLKRLAQLDLLGKPTLQTKVNASLNNRDVLRFEIRLTPTLSFLESPTT